jgi:CheY-like chemotaxis protein
MTEQLKVVVVAQGSRRVGIVVSEALGEHECVIKRLPWNLQRIEAINGAVVLPDGSVALALDPYHLLGAAENWAAAEATYPERATQAGARRPRILVVDDSLTSRTLERNILLAAGYEVDVAADGAEAWTRLCSMKYDVLVADVQMPGMDGFELTRTIRAHAKLRSLPVILVTGLGRAEDIACGAAAGADEYLVKGQFEHDKLLEAVGRHLFGASVMQTTN